MSRGISFKQHELLQRIAGYTWRQQRCVESFENFACMEPGYGQRVVVPPQAAHFERMQKAWCEHTGKTLAEYAARERHMGVSTSHLARQYAALSDASYKDAPATWQRATLRALESLRRRGLVEREWRNVLHFETFEAENIWDVKPNAQGSNWWWLTERGDAMRIAGARDYSRRHFLWLAKQDREWLQQKVEDDGLFAYHARVVIWYLDGDRGAIDQALEKFAASDRGQPLPRNLLRKSATAKRHARNPRNNQARPLQHSQR